MLTKAAFIWYSKNSNIVKYYYNFKQLHSEATTSVSHDTSDTSIYIFMDFSFSLFNITILLYRLAHENPY